VKTSHLPEQNANQRLVAALCEKINSQYIPDDLLREYTQFLISFNRLLVEKNQTVKLTKKIFIVICLLLSGISISAQCIATPTAPSCNPAGSSVLVANDVVGAGQIKTINANGNYGSLTISGGTLIVCSSATISSFAFSGGAIIVNTGGNFVINNGGAAVAFGNNCIIHNFGNIQFNVSIVTGQNNIIHNATTSSVFTVAFNQFVLQGPNTFLVNNGIFNSSYFIVQSTNSPGPVCSGAPSAIVTNFMINQYANAFTSPNGPSCINITQMVINNQPMTSSSNVNICYQASNVTISGSANFGNATVNNNCASCSIVLPLRIVEFNGICDENKALLEWKTRDEAGTDHFNVERSTDGVNYELVGSVKAQKNGNTYNTYTFSSETQDLGPNVFYYRIKQIEISGETFYSKIVAINCNTELELNVAPSITENYFTVSSIYTLDLVTVYDAAGRLIHTSYYNNEHFFTTIVNNTLARGVYLVRVRTSNGKMFNRKVVFN
jgi:hypothetical protein